MKPEVSPEPEKIDARPTRLNFNLSGKARAELDRLAATAGCTLTEVVRLGLMLAKVYYELAPDEQLAVIKDGEPVKVILPPVGF